MLLIIGQLWMGNAAAILGVLTLMGLVRRGGSWLSFLMGLARRYISSLECAYT